MSKRAQECSRVVKSAFKCSKGFCYGQTDGEIPLSSYKSPLGLKKIEQQGDQLHGADLNQSSSHPFPASLISIIKIDQRCQSRVVTKANIHQRLIPPIKAAPHFPALVQNLKKIGIPHSWPPCLGWAAISTSESINKINITSFPGKRLLLPSRPMGHYFPIK